MKNSRYIKVLKLKEDSRLEKNSKPKENSSLALLETWRNLKKREFIVLYSSEFKLHKLHTRRKLKELKERACESRNSQVKNIFNMQNSEKNTSLTNSRICEQVYQQKLKFLGKTCTTLNITNLS